MSCSGQEQPELALIDQREADARAIDQQLDEIIERFTASDEKIETYLSYFHEDAILMPPGLQPIRGIDSIRAFYAPHEGNFANTSKLFYTDRFFEVEDSMAVRRYTGYVELYINGDTLVSDNKYVDVLVKGADGSWKILWHSWSSNL
jgi:ketosteroid isomerase-like protein